MTSVPTDMPESLYLLSEDYDGPDDELQDKLIQSLYPAKAPAYELAPIYRKVNELTTTASTVSSIEQINEYLLSVNFLILRLCGNSDWHTAPKAVDERCYFLGNTPLRGSFGSGCKTDEEVYNEKKRNVMTILKDLIVYMLRCVERTNKELLKETNHFIVNLFTTIRSYCYFISYQTISRLYDTYIKMLVDEVNSIFEPVLGSDLVLNRCKNVSVNGSSISGYGCGREAYIAHRSSKTQEDSDNQRIVIISTDDSGYGEARAESSKSILGGRRSRKTRCHKTRQRKTRCRN
jgi:hypothetical protein